MRQYTEASCKQYHWLRVNLPVFYLQLFFFLAKSEPLVGGSRFFGRQYKRMKGYRDGQYVTRYVELYLYF